MRQLIEQKQKYLKQTTVCRQLKSASGWRYVSNNQQ